MDTRNSPDVEVVKDAERILLPREMAGMRGTRRVATGTNALTQLTRLFPDSPVIHVVAVDGVVVGRVGATVADGSPLGPGSAAQSPTATLCTPPSRPLPQRGVRGDPHHDDYGQTVRR